MLCPDRLLAQVKADDMAKSAFSGLFFISGRAYFTIRLRDNFWLKTVRIGITDPVGLDTSRPRRRQPDLTINV